jgi:hypothetical protein
LPIPLTYRVAPSIGRARRLLAALTLRRALVLRATVSRMACSWIVGQSFRHRHLPPSYISGTRTLSLYLYSSSSRIMTPTHRAEAPGTRQERESDCRSAPGRSARGDRGIVSSSSLVSFRHGRRFCDCRNRAARRRHGAAAFYQSPPSAFPRRESLSARTPPMICFGLR